MSIEEILQLSGVAAHTIPPQDLDILSSMQLSEEKLNSKSLFKNDSLSAGNQERRSYLNDEAKYRLDFAASENGLGHGRLYQVLSLSFWCALC